MAKKPHILIFNPDQWRGDVMGHMGNPAAVTPNLDQFAKNEAVSFRYAYCQNPVSTPSRCSFMTGWYPHVRGHSSMNYMLRLEENEPFLLKKLKDDGYYVWWGGKNDVVSATSHDDFGDSCHVKNMLTDEVESMFSFDKQDQWRGSPEGDRYYSFLADRLESSPNRDCYYDNDWHHVFSVIEMIHNAPKDQPLCIYLPLVYPHPPYAIEESWYQKIDQSKLPPRIPAPKDWSDKPAVLKGIYDRNQLASWDETRWDELRAVYYAMCARVDYQFKLVTDALREAGFYDDTAVFFFSDHGDYTGDFGLVQKNFNTFEEQITRVPFIVKLPADLPVQPRTSDAMVELIDFTATVYDITGIDPGYSHFGKSLRPVIAGETDEHRDAVFCEGGRLHEDTHCKDGDAITRENIYWPSSSQQHKDDGPECGKAIMCRTKEFKYVQRLYEADELYDLKKDPQELHNCIGLPEYAEIQHTLEKRLMRFMLETSSVLPFDRDTRFGNR